MRFQYGATDLPVARAPIVIVFIVDLLDIIRYIPIQQARAMFFTGSAEV